MADINFTCSWVMNLDNLCILNANSQSTVINIQCKKLKQMHNIITGNNPRKKGNLHRKWFIVIIKILKTFKHHHHHHHNCYMQMKVTILVQSMFLGILGTCESMETLTQQSNLIIVNSKFNWNCKLTSHILTCRAYRWVILWT